MIITIAYDMWHTPAGAFMEISDAEVVELAIADIRNILTERSILRVGRIEGKWVCSSLENASDFLTARPGVVRNIYLVRNIY